MLCSICVCTYNRVEHLTLVFQSIYQTCRQPYEIVVVDDCSTNADVLGLLRMFQRLFSEKGVDFRIEVNVHNMGHAASQNLAWDLAKGDVLFHLEDDIVMPVQGWNLEFAKMLADHPEVGQVIPEGSGLGEYIPWANWYREFAWGLGGCFAVRREVYEKVGGWRVFIRHQLEPEFNLRVRMAGWRLAEVPGIRMVHLGEGEKHDTFERQAQIVIGVYTMLLLWNRRFQGPWAYDSLWSMSWDDFPPNVAFRRRLAAYFAAMADRLAQQIKEKYRITMQDDTQALESWSEECKQALQQWRDFRRCRMNTAPEPFSFPGHWGKFEIVKYIRPPNREREAELVQAMLNNDDLLKDEYTLPQMLRGLAVRYGRELSDEELARMLRDVPVDFVWEARPVYGNRT